MKDLQDIIKENKSSQWLVLDKPIGEPEAANDWPEGKQYWIEREVTSTGIVIWRGIEKNWVKDTNGIWTELVNDEPIDFDEELESQIDEDEEIEESSSTTLMVVNDDYEDFTFILCNEPIYEKKYREEKKKQE